MHAVQDVLLTGADPQGPGLEHGDDGREALGQLPQLLGLHEGGALGAVVLDAAHGAALEARVDEVGRGQRRGAEKSQSKKCGVYKKYFQKLLSEISVVKC